MGDSRVCNEDGYELYLWCEGDKGLETSLDACLPNPPAPAPLARARLRALFRALSAVSARSSASSRSFCSLRTLVRYWAAKFSWEKNTTECEISRFQLGNLHLYISSAVVLHLLQDMVNTKQDKVSKQQTWSPISLKCLIQSGRHRNLN